MCSEIHRTSSSLIAGNSIDSVFASQSALAVRSSGESSLSLIPRKYPFS